MFTTPVQVQTQAGASAPAPVQDRSVQAGLSGLADMFSMLSQVGRASGPDAFVVKENWETEGHQAAVEDAKQYQLLLETKGRGAADAFRTKTGLERTSTMNATTADAYFKTWKTTYGESQDIVDRSREEETLRANEKVVRDLTEQGRALVIANAVPGVDINNVSEGELVALARVYNGQKAKLQLDTDQIAYQSAARNNMLGERKLKSEAGMSAFLAQNTADIKAKLFTIAKAMEQGGKAGEAAKLEGLAYFQQLKTQLAANATSFVGSVGGDFNDIGLDRLNLLNSQIDTVTDMINGKFAGDSMQQDLTNLSLSNALDSIPRLPTGLARSIYIQNAVRLPLSLQEKVIKDQGIPLANENWVEALRNVTMGAASAVANTGVPTTALYDGIVKATQSDDPSVTPDAATALVNSLQETFQSPTGIRQVASSPNGVPALMAGLARMTKPSETFTAAIQEAAARENTTPEELWTRSVEGMFRETIAPSLQFKDPYVLSNIDLQYSNGKFTVKLNEERYRQESGLKPNPGYYSGIDATKSQINTINSNLLRLQGVLNDSVKGYERVMQGNPDDVAAAIKAQLDMVMGVNRIYQGK